MKKTLRQFLIATTALLAVSIASAAAPATSLCEPTPQALQQFTKLNPSGFGDITAFKHGEGGGGITSAQKSGRIYDGSGYLVGAYGDVTSFGKDLSS